MAGVPSIMQVMLDEGGAKLKTGVRMLSETVGGPIAGEGDIGHSARRESPRPIPRVSIGSYPFLR